MKWLVLHINIDYKRGESMAVISDSNGKPVSFHLSKANESDIQFVLPCLNKIRVKQKVKNLGGDKGYILRSVNIDLRNRGIIYTIG